MSKIRDDSLLEDAERLFSEQKWDQCFRCKALSTNKKHCYNCGAIKISIPVSELQKHA